MSDVDTWRKSLVWQLVRSRIIHCNVPHHPAVPKVKDIEERLTSKVITLEQAFDEVQQLYVWLLYTPSTVVVSMAHEDYVKCHLSGK